MKIIELFSGYGSQALALKNLGFEVESKISEIDKYAIQAYEQIHGKTINYGDISKIKALGDADMWTYSFPCQDLSVAGKQAGIKSGTQSGLLYEVERLLEVAVYKNKNQPKYLLLENVKALVSKKFMPDFQRWLDKLEQLGYNNYWQVLNAKDHGIPQNRERVFVVSIRKDIDTKGYKFPSPVPLEKRLKDMLEPWVDVKYYLSADKVEKLITQIKEKEVSNTIRCGGGGSLDGKHTCDIIVEPLAYDEQNRYIRKDGCVGTLTTDGSSPKHNNRVIEPKIIQNSHRFNKGRIFENAPTITSSGKYQDNNFLIENFRIRKLTPRECWRLMGVKDEQFNRLHGISNSQLYKLAGNSIVVNVLEAIFRSLFTFHKKEKEKQLSLF